MAGLKRTGFKSRGKPLTAKKPMRKRSPKKAAYMASQERKDALAHMGRVKQLPCIVCAAPPPSEAHHCTGDGMARDDMKTIPLCYACHRGPRGYHAAKRTWEANNGKDYDLVPRVMFLLYGGD